MLYGTECWVVKSQQQHKLNVPDMKILCWMSRHMGQDRIENEYIRNKVGVALIEEKMVELQSNWQHCKRKKKSKF